MQETSFLLSPKNRCKRPALSTRQMQETSSLHKTDASDQLYPLSKGQMQENSSLLSPRDRCKRPALSTRQMKEISSLLSPQDRCKRLAGQMQETSRTDARD
jgi:hypothetical protein